MGLRDILTGRHQVKGPAPDRLFAISTAYVTLQSEHQIEPAIKELSSCLLYPDSTAAELDECVQKFEAAIASMRSVQQGLQGSMERVRNLGDQLLRS